MKLPEKSVEMMTGKVLAAIMDKISSWIRKIEYVTLFEVDIFATRHPGEDIDIIISAVHIKVQMSKASNLNANNF